MPADLYDTCREINRLLGFVAFCWLTYRTVRSWPADWAKPDHVAHYRALLCITSGFALSVSFSAFQYERSGADAGPVSLGYTLLCLAVAALCWVWPHPAAWSDPSRKD